MVLPGDPVGPQRPHNQPRRGYGRFVGPSLGTLVLIAVVVILVVVVL